MPEAAPTAGVPFSLDRDGLRPADDGPWVEKDAAVVYRVGEYPFPAHLGGHFSMTPDELKAALADFPPEGLPLTDEHNPSSVFYKRGLGKLHSPVPAADWSAFGAKLRLRKAVAEHMLPPGPIKLSVNIDRATKRFKDVSLTDTPRITDAAAFAAFAKSEGPMEHTPHGRTRMQMMHDMAAEGGALCKGAKSGKGKDEAPFTSTHERDAMQAIHDTATGMGADCNVYSDPPAQQLKAKREDMMASYSTAFGPEPSARERELEARLKAVEDERAAEKQAREREKEAAFSARLAGLGGEAEAFADSLPKLPPAWRKACVAELRQAREDDLRHGEVSFSGADGRPARSTRSAMAEARWRDIHGGLYDFTEELAPSRVAALFSDPGPAKGVSPGRRKQLLAASAFGQALLRDEAAAGRNGK